MKTALYRRTLLASAVAFGMSGVVQNAAAVDIDQFNDPSFTQKAEPDFVDELVVGGIGGFRRVSGECTNCAAGQDFVSIRILNGKFSHSQESDYNGRSRVIWSGNAGTGFGATDFTDGMTSNAIRVYVNDTDDNTTGNSISLTLTDLGANTATQKYDMGAASPSVFYIDFLLSGFGGVNPAQITKVQMDVDGTGKDDWDMDVDSIATACSGNTNTPEGSETPNNGVCEPPPPPEPPEVEHPKTVPAMTPLGLLGLGAGLVGIAGFFARRRKK